MNKATHTHHTHTTHTPHTHTHTPHTHPHHTHTPTHTHTHTTHTHPYHTHTPTHTPHTHTHTHTHTGTPVNGSNLNYTKRKYTYIYMNLYSCDDESGFQTFALFWTLHSFFWVIPRCLNFVSTFRKTVSSFLLTTLMKLEQTECSETLEHKIQTLEN